MLRREFAEMKAGTVLRLHPINWRKQPKSGPQDIIIARVVDDTVHADPFGGDLSAPFVPPVVTVDGKRRRALPWGIPDGPQRLVRLEKYMSRTGDTWHAQDGFALVSFKHVHGVWDAQAAEAEFDGRDARRALAVELDKTWSALAAFQHREFIERVKVALREDGHTDLADTGDLADRINKGQLTEEERATALSYARLVALRAWEWTGTGTDT